MSLKLNTLAVALSAWKLDTRLQPSRLVPEDKSEGVENSLI